MGKASDRKFGKIYLKLAAARASSDRKLASATSQLTASTAKRSALYDARFQKTVKNMALARKQAFLQVQQARKGFTTQLSGIVSSVKDQETRLQGEIAVVSSEVASNKASQIRINRKLDAEKRRITKIMDSRHSSSMKWRGRFFPSSASTVPWLRPSARSSLRRHTPVSASSVLVLLATVARLLRTSPRPPAVSTPPCPLRRPVRLAGSRASRVLWLRRRCPLPVPSPVLRVTSRPS